MSSNASKPPCSHIRVIGTGRCGDPGGLVGSLARDFPATVPARSQEITRLQIRLERMAENEQRLVGRAEQFRKEADEHESRWRLEKEKRLQSERLRSTAEGDQMFLSVEVAGLKEQRELGQARSVRSGSIFPLLPCRQICDHIWPPLPDPWFSIPSIDSDPVLHPSFL